MKKLHYFAVLALFLAAAPALAQQVQNHAVPIGKGVGVTGFGAAVPGTTGRPLVSTGAATDPAFGQAVNGGLVPGAANTLKGSLDGTTVTDTAVPSCTAVGQALRWTAGVGFSCGAVNVTTGFDTPINLGLTASAAGSALTLNVTQAGGSAPTSTSPVQVAFRSLTASTGTVAYSNITSALSLVIPSGATLGTSNAVPFRIWIFLVANGGTPAIGVATCSTATTIYPCAGWEYSLKTSVAIGAGSTAAGTLYATAAIVSDAVRIIGYCDFANGLVTAGTWASGCTTLQVFGPGIKKPGDIVQTVSGTYSTQQVITSASFVTLVEAFSITPTSTINPVQVTLNGAAGVASGFFAVQLGRGAGPTMVGNLFQSAVPSTVAVTLSTFDLPQSVSAVTYTVYGKSSAGGTLTWLSSSTYQNISTCVIQEIMGFDVREPANDNVNPGLFSATG